MAANSQRTVDVAIFASSVEAVAAERQEQESEDLAALADRRGQQARDANQQGDDYVLLTVLFASVLFCGISTKLTSRRLQTVMLSFATVFLLAGVVIELTFPIEI